MSLLKQRAPITPADLCQPVVLLRSDKKAVKKFLFPIFLLLLVPFITFAFTPTLPDGHAKITKDQWVVFLILEAGIATLYYLRMKPVYLKVTDEGFTNGSVFRKSLVPWSEVSRFDAVTMQNVRLVVYDRPSRARGFMGWLNRKLLGASDSLDDNYGMTPDALAAFLNGRRERALPEGYRLPPYRTPSFITQKPIFVITGIVLLLIFVAVGIGITVADHRNMPKGPEAPSTAWTSKTTHSVLPPSSVYSIANNLQTWVTVAPWLDSDVKGVYAGPQTGAGSSYAWDRFLDKGSISIRANDPDRMVTVAIDIEDQKYDRVTTKAPGCPGTIVLEIVPENGGGSALTWKMEKYTSQSCQLADQIAAMQSNMGQLIEVGGQRTPAREFLDDMFDGAEKPSARAKQKSASKSKP
jgi:hypothetical protein